MEVSSKENIVGLTSNRSIIKASVTQSIKKPASTKKALADVGNILHSAKKSTQEFSKPSHSGQKLESTKNFKIFVEDKDVMFSPVPKKASSKRIPLSPVSPSVTKVVAKLDPGYYYDSGDSDVEDGHDSCSSRQIDDDFDNILPLSLRLNSDDFDSLASFKPHEEPKESQWKTNLSEIAEWDDLNDFNVPFPSPPGFIEYDDPFSRFTVPDIKFDDSF